MQRVIKSLSKAGSTEAIVVSWQFQFQIGFGVVLSAGASLTYTIQYTFDNVLDPLVTPTWFDHPIVAAQTTNQPGNFAYPVAAIRLTVSSWVSGTATLTLLSAAA